MTLDTFAVEQVNNLFALPWAQPPSPLKYKQILGPVQQTLIYRIPSQGRYAEQIQRILRAAWKRLTPERKRGSQLYMSFEFHPLNPRFTQPTAEEAADGVGPYVFYSDGLQETRDGPRYLLTSSELSKLTFPNQQNTRFLLASDLKGPTTLNTAHVSIKSGPLRI